MDIDDAFICFSRSQHPPALLPSEASANGRGKVLLPSETTGNSLTTERSIAQHSAAALLNLCSNLSAKVCGSFSRSWMIKLSRANVDREHSKLSSEDLFKCCLDLYIYIYVYIYIWDMLRYCQSLSIWRWPQSSPRWNLSSHFFWPWGIAELAWQSAVHCWCFQFGFGLPITESKVQWSIDKLNVDWKNGTWIRTSWVSTKHVLRQQQLSWLPNS